MLVLLWGSADFYFQNFNFSLLFANFDFLC